MSDSGPQPKANNKGRGWQASRLSTFTPHSTRCPAGRLADLEMLVIPARPLLHHGETAGI